MTGIETTVAAQAARAAPTILGSVKHSLAGRRLLERAELLAIGSESPDWLYELSPAQNQQLLQLTASQEFYNLMLQAVVLELCDHNERSHRDDLRTQVRSLIKYKFPEGFDAGKSILATDSLMELLQTSAFKALLGVPRSRDPWTAVLASRVATAAARNSELLATARNSLDTEQLASRLRSQIRFAHRSLKLPGAVITRAVPWDDLHVPPSVTKYLVAENAYSQATLMQTGADDSGSRDANQYFGQNQFEDTLRCVILGDPGGGKSTLAEKLAYDLAGDDNVGARTIPILIVLRDHSELLRRHANVLQLIEATLSAPYGINVSLKDLELFLLNGRLTLIFDGVDELGAAHHRSDFARLLENFAFGYPLTRIIITARASGYDSAALDLDWFPLWRMQPFDRGQISSYAHRWFKHEGRGTLKDAFMLDINGITDLAQNPLMLSLLCVLYTSEQEIPRSRADVYAKCSELLFQKWDRSRGIIFEPEMQTMLRGVIQDLAWRIYVDKYRRGALPRRQLQAFIAARLVAKLDSLVEAEALADEFLEFCTGRAWVLSDVSSDDVEPHFGFVHRTFYEYFTASRMVRHASSADELWTTLRATINDPSIQMVSHLAVQLYDRQYDDGADRVIRAALQASREESLAVEDRSSILESCAAWLDSVAPNTDSIRAVVKACLDLAREVTLRERVVSTGSAVDIRADRAILRLTAVRLPENVKRIGRSLADFAGVDGRYDPFGQALACASFAEEVGAVQTHLRLAVHASTDFRVFGDVLEQLRTAVIYIDHSLLGSSLRFFGYTYRIESVALNVNHP